MINKCQHLKCGKDFKTEKKDKKFCSNDCYINDRKENPEKYLNGTFKKGSSPWNLGKGFSKIGRTTIKSKKLVSGGKKNLRFINVGDENGRAKYIRNDKFVWEQANGPIPDGFVVYHKDGRSLNDDINNLECIELSEALSRYSSAKNVVLDLKNKNHLKKIIKGCKTGNKRIQKILFDAAYGKVYRTAMTYTNDNDSAQEIVSNSFVKIFNKIATFNLDGSFEGWIGKIVANTAIDSIRKSKKTLVVDTSEMEYVDCLTTEDKEFELEELDEIKGIPSKEVIRLIQELPEGYRTTFNLIVFQGYSHLEVADKMGVVEGTSKSNYSKARLILQEKIRELLEKRKLNNQKSC